MTISIADRAPWLSQPGLQKLLAALAQDGEEARLAGGAVRNTLLGEPVADIDIATTTLPDETEKRARAAGFRTVPTGKDHGTITVVGDEGPYEVTTLRADVETNGRHARVVFGRDWSEDAQRRDFTINALYATADGAVIDLVGGLADIADRRLRFIGDADMRIREDYLRILRFFRFFARYGSGRPDADGLRACARLKAGLSGLSAERVWAELKKLLEAPDPSRALLWMRQSGVLTAILPESEKWGIDAIHGLVATERDLGWPVDPLLRLVAIVPPDSERMAAMAERLRMSKSEAVRIAGWAEAQMPEPSLSEEGFAKRLYRGDRQGIEDRLRLGLASARSAAIQDDQALIRAGAIARLLRQLETTQRPMFPVKGADLLAAGIPAGKQIGEVLEMLEREWVDSGFRLERGALVERATSIASGAVADRP